MSKYTSYYLYQKYERRGEQEAIPVTPNVFSIDGDGTMQKVIKLEDDPQCGYDPPTDPIYRWINIPITQDYICEDCEIMTIYRWVNLDASVDYYCDGTTKYYKQKKQVSHDAGVTWSDVIPYEYQRGGIAETSSIGCGYVPPAPQYKWENMDIKYNWVCDSCEGGETIIYKAKGILINGVEFLVECDNNRVINAGDIDDSATKIMLGECMDTIGNDAFKDFLELEGVQFNTRLTRIGNNAFMGSNKLIDCSLPESVVSIGSSAFENCLSLYYLTIPSSVTSIGSRAFFNCDSLIQVSIPDGVKRIESNIFGNCDGLDEVTIGSGVTYFDYQAFSEARRMNSLTILSPTPPETNGTPSLPSGCVVHVPCSAFLLYSNANGWKNIISQIVPIESECRTDKLYAEYSDGSTYAVPYNGNQALTREETTGTSVSYKNMVSAELGPATFSLSDSVFKSFTSLSSITLNDNITSIPNSAFYGCTNLTSFDASNISNIGDSSFEGCGSLTSVTFNTNGVHFGKDSFKGCGLTELNLPAFSSTYATVFNNCSNLRTITIGGNQSIGYYPAMSFRGCNNISSVTFTSGVTSIVSRLFSDNPSTFFATIPQSVKSIGDYAFGGCSNMYGDLDLSGVEQQIGLSAFCGTKITSVSTSANVIRMDAFSGCSSLTSLTLNEGVQYINAHAFAGCSFSSVTFPTTIEGQSGSEVGSAFGDNLVTANFAYGCRTIPSRILTRCTSLSSVTIPNSVTGIGSWAFSGCTSLASATIPDGVTNIGREAFGNCGLTHLTIPSSVGSLGEDNRKNVFSGCSSIETIEVNRNNTVYDSRNNCNAIIETSTNTLITGCKNTVIPNTVTSIGWDAFANCSGLTSITIPNSVTSIGVSAFQDCTGLASVTIQDGVTSIYYKAFSKCTSLASITIPDSVTIIDTYTFSYCSSLTTVGVGSGITSIGDSAFASTSLTSITVNATTPPTLGSGVFPSSISEIRVPSASVFSYKTANGWKNYSNIIIGI